MDFRELAFKHFYEYYISSNTSKDELIENHTELSNNQSIRYKQLVVNTLENLETIILFVSESSTIGLLKELCQWRKYV